LLTQSTQTNIILGMEIADLTREMHRFVQEKGWYDPQSDRPQTLRNLAISLTLEAAEVLEHFQWADAPRDPQALPDELADVALYLLQISSLAGIDLEQAIQDKLAKNFGRKWSTGKENGQENPQDKEP
jgi:NTP pyrophosphatase (non-canonical NTP hydrolase)